MSTVIDDAEWLSAATTTGFGPANLPYGVVRRADEVTVAAVRIGDHAIDLSVLHERGTLSDVPIDGADLRTGRLNELIARGPDAWGRLRSRLQELVLDSRSNLHRLGPALTALDDVTVLMPIEVGDFVDFYSSLHHATNAGRLFRPDAPLLPNWRHVPIGYHGRAGTIVPSATPIARPVGQWPPDTEGGRPGFGPSRELDFELELGLVTSGCARPWECLTQDTADDHIFGMVLVNDWSARDIQRWEYRPLGPFLGKSFATTISCWVVPMAALARFAVPAIPQEPQVLEYLQFDDRRSYDIQLEVEITPAGSVDPHRIVSTNARELYWTAAQQLVHATVNGATLRAGDLFASGTISGAAPGSQGCLLEATRGGREAVVLADGERRTWLRDGDEVAMHAVAGFDGDAPVRFSPCTGRVTAPRVSQSARP